MNKVLKVAALGASIIGLASVASAADLNMNIYGASAQGKFWNTYAEQFLKASTTATPAPGMGCTSTTKGYQDAGQKLGITVGFNCAGNGGDDVYIRYTANKSVEGPRAVMNLDPQENDSCITGNPTNDPNRAQADWDGSAITKTCLPVHVGASDVASESFTQESHGAKNGNYTTTQYDEVLQGQVIPGLDEIGTAAQPIVVPFAFFANNALNVDNLSRQQMLLLLSNNVYNWNQFGTGYENKKVVLCMRHAGSGTHATLDKAIMRGDAALPTLDARNVPVPVKKAGVMFHESSSDMMKCVNENGLYTTASAAAIGYADADANVSAYNTDGTYTKKYASVKELKYNGLGEGITPANLATYGASALKNQIKYGQYEFWSSQWMYLDRSTEDTNTEALYDKMMTYASKTTLPCPGIGCYWLTGSELKVKKGNDSVIPTF